MTLFEALNGRAFTTARARDRSLPNGFFEKKKSRRLVLVEIATPLSKFLNLISKRGKPTIGARLILGSPEIYEISNLCTRHKIKKTSKNLTLSFLGEL